MERLRVTLLGPFEVSRGDAVLPVTGARLQGLLVRLALADGHPVEPNALIDAVWADEPASVPALHTLVSRLRRALGPDSIVQVTGGYRLEAADVDAVRFEQLAVAGRDHLRAGDAESARTALAEADILWTSAPAIIAAVAPTVATRLAHLSIEVVADLADAELSLGRPDAAAARLARMQTEHPAHERTAALLMDALAAQGRQAEALTVYDRIRATLADTLGADPGTALRERHLHLLQAEPPEPPDAPRAIPELPASLTSFIGRDDDLARIDLLFTSGRLVTVVGSGGAGKTRLALEAARRRPTWLIDLAPITEPDELAAAVLAAIGVRGGPLLDGRTRVDELDALVGELARRPALLLVDNCEHLLDAVARLVTTLLTRCPTLRVLATSREPLAIDGEALVPLGPLELPADVNQARAAASVRLFTERAAAVRPGFAVDDTTAPYVVRVVQKLDGLPLALELAAARLRTLSLPDLAAGLSDRFRMLTTGSRTAPSRHRTLRAVIAWSWDLLDEPERTVAEQISVLPGGVVPASAAAVCVGTAVAADDLPDLLAALVDRSLLQLAPDSGRYRMLESIREYGAERLAEAGELGPARDRAAAHFAELMTRHDARLRGPGQPDVLDTITVEYDNTLAALRHRCAADDSPGATALALALVWYWQMSGRQADGTHWLAEVLRIPADEPTPEHDCVRAVHLVNRADVMSGRTAEEAAADRAEMTELARRLLAYPDLPDHYRVFGPILLFLQNEQEAARTAFQHLADGDDGWLAGLGHLFLGELSGDAGTPDGMRVHVEAALDRFRAAGDRWGQAAVLSMRAQLRRYDDLDGALADLRAADAMAAEFGPPSLGDQVYGDLRWVDLYVRRGDTDRALAVLASARDRGSPPDLLDVAEADLRVRLGDLDRADELLARAPESVPTFCVRAALCLARGDLLGADTAVHAGRTAARTAQELSMLTVHAAQLAFERGNPHESATLLRGAHDRTDPRIHELTRRIRTALSAEDQ